MKKSLKRDGNSIRIETWKGKKVVVARDNGSISSWSYKKKFSLAFYRDIYSRNKTFNTDIKKEVNKYSKVKQVTYTTVVMVSGKGTKEHYQKSKGKISSMS